VFLSEIQGRSKWSDGVFTGIWSADPGDGVLSVRLFPVGMALGAVLWRKLAAAGGRGWCVLGVGAWFLGSSVRRGGGLWRDQSAAFGFLLEFNLQLARDEGAPVRVLLKDQI